ncbi:MAG: hypothetical protein E7252_02350 [Lachnospira sp.]|nr:hypothetical protein [Lachnospira sp.]
MRKIKFVIIGMVLLMLFVFLKSCYNDKHGAEIYSKSNDMILTSFLENNKVKGAYYKDTNYDENAKDSTDRYYYDEASPESRTFLIKDQETFEKIFVKNAFDVNFEQEILCLYIFADIYPNRKYVIDNVTIEEKHATIYFRIESNNKKDVAAPYQRCLIVKLKEKDISSVEFIKQR